MSLEPKSQPTRFDRALASAVNSGDLKGCLRALARGASPNGPLHRASFEDEYDPLYLAINRGLMPTFLALLNAGADPNLARGIGGHSPPLHYACSDGRLDMALALLSFGARLDARCLIGGQALAESCMTCFNAQIARALLAAGADPNHANLQGSRALLFCAGQIEPERQRESLLIAQLLIEAGADPLATDLSGETAVSRALFFGHFEMAALIHSAIERQSLDRALPTSAAISGSAFRL